MLRRTQLLKFFVSNGSGKRIQRVIWGDKDIDALKDFIIADKVI